MDNQVSMVDVATSASVQLFVDRALQTGFQLTPDNAGVVALICLRLEVIPLALELAAAQARTISPAAILERLTYRLSAPVDGPRDLDVHQQSFHETIARSHNLLAVEQAVVFRCLGVFSGGFTIAAAEAVCRDAVMQRTASPDDSCSLPASSFPT